MEINGILINLYYLSGVILAIVAILGLNQIRLLKRDYSFRVERSAKEKAIEATRIFETEFIPLSNKFLVDRIKANKPSIVFYKAPVGDFTNQSIPKECLETALEREKILSWMPMLNCLESISAYFTTGVADEQIGYKIIGRSFCANVEYQYDIISLSRSSKPLSHFSNIVALYKIWSPRLTKEELFNAKQNLDSQIAVIKDEQINAIGNN